MHSSPITDRSLEGDWLWESGEVFYIAVNGHLAKTKSSGNFRHGKEQFALLKWSLTAPEILFVGDLHLGNTLSPLITVVLPPTSILKQRTVSWIEYLYLQNTPLSL